MQIAVFFSLLVLALMALTLLAVKALFHAPRSTVEAKSFLSSLKAKGFQTEFIGKNIVPPIHGPKTYILGQATKEVDSRTVTVWIERTSAGYPQVFGWQTKKTDPYYRRKDHIFGLPLHWFYPPYSLVSVSLEVQKNPGINATLCRGVRPYWNSPQKKVQLQDQSKAAKLTLFSDDGTLSQALQLSGLISWYERSSIEYAILITDNFVQLFLGRMDEVQDMSAPIQDALRIAQLLEKQD